LPPLIFSIHQNRCSYIQITKDIEATKEHKAE
jgi:hypothetical protein